MAFNVIFYKFNKHYNSTKRPDAQTTPQVTYSCNILRGSAVYNPKIELDFGLSSTPAQYNYCYIADFDSRYYFIREWTFDKGIWIASLQEDCLASWRNTIGATYFYILRSAHTYDGNVMDGMYPTKAIPTYSKVALTNPYTTVNNGCFVIGVVSKGGNFGSLTYHAMTAAELAGLCTALIDPTIISGNADFSLNDASAGLQLNLIDPMQYIKSCVWLPIAAADIAGTDIPASGPTGGFDIFNWHLTGFTHKILSNDTPYVTKSNTVTLKSHPQKSTRGNYVQMAPYTIITLSYPPFGVFQIDNSAIGTTTKLYTYLRIDVLTGAAALEVKLNSNIVNRVEAQVGVPIALSQVSRNYIGAANEILGAVGSIASGVGAAVSGNAMGAIGGAIGAAQGIINGYASLQPRANTIGSGGGFGHLQGAFELDYQFYSAVDDDLTNNGRPLCQMKKPEDIPGFMIIQDGYFEGAATFAEAEEIRSLLESGFYWE